MKDRSAASTLYEGRHLRLVQKDGWEYVERIGVSGIVLILAVTESEQLILTEQYRVPVDGRVIELPAGLAGDTQGAAQEDLKTAAQRELLEETGYQADEWTLLTEGPPSAGLSTEVVSLFRANGLRKVGSGGGEGDENIQVHEVPLESASLWLRERARRGNLIDPKVYTGLYWAWLR